MDIRFNFSKRLLETLRSGTKSKDRVADAAKAPANPVLNNGMEEVIALDGIEKKYSASHDFTRVTNKRLSDLLSGRLGPKALKYRRSGTLCSVHFSKQVLLSVAEITRPGPCSIPFVVQEYLQSNHPEDFAEFLLTAEFFDKEGRVLQAAPDGEGAIVGHAQVLEIKAQTGLCSYAHICAPQGTARALLSFMTVNTGDDIVLVSDFSPSRVLPTNPIGAWHKSNEQDVALWTDIHGECQAILPVRPDNEILFQISASSLDPDGSLSAPCEKALVIDVAFLDARGKLIPGRYRGTARSERFLNYMYLASVEDSESFRSKILPTPPDASWLRIKLVPWAKHKRIRLNGPVLYGTPDLDTVAIASQFDKDSTELLWATEKAAARSGKVSLRRDILRSIYQRAGSDAAANRLKAASGLLRELDETWVPQLPVPPADSSQPNFAGDLKICHLHKVAYPYENSGGAIRNLNIVRYQKAAGMNPYVVLPLFYPFDREDGRGFSTRIESGIPYFEFTWPKPTSNLSPDRLLEYNTLLTYSVVRAFGADVIHAASGFRGYELALQGIALRDKLGIPLIYEVRSFHEHTWGPCSEENLQAEHTRLRIRKENFCMRSADHVITISEAMRHLLIERGVPNDRIDVVPNGVDADAFLQSKATGTAAREKYDLKGKIVVGYISNMSRREGHDVLIEAIKGLVDNGTDVKCLLVGDGPEKGRLEQLAATLGIRERIVFTGIIDHAEIHDYYRAMDLFVVPRRPDFASDYVTPLKPFEAMALGVPIVASDRPALREIVGDNERGMLFQAESPDSLLTVLKDLIANETHRARLADAAKQWVFRERTWEATCRVYSEIYAKVISRFTASALPRAHSESAVL